MAGFIMWAAGGCLIIALGISAFGAKKEAGFWANVRPLPMKDVKGHNRAVGKLFITFGLVMILLGLPLLTGSGAAVVVSVVGMMLETIVSMIVYTLAIQPKYEKK